MITVTVDKEKLKKFLIKNFLPLGFVVVVFISLLWPLPGEHVAHWMSNGWKIVTTLNMCIIFFIFGLTLETAELLQAVKAWKTLILGVVLILVLTSFTGFIPLVIPFKPVEFAIGLAIFACVPTSLSSGVTLVIQGYGNGALALLFTVSTNALGIITSPLFVKLVLGSRIPNARIDSKALLLKLSVSIMMPLLVGKALRELYKPTLEFAKKYKVPMYMMNNLQIMCIVWQTLSLSRHVLLEQEPYDVFLAVMAAIIQHMCFLLMNMMITWVIRIPEKERKAVVIMCSQKSLPTAAVIISYMDPQVVGNIGLISIPCIVFYIMQLFIDAYLANSWASKYEKYAAMEGAYQQQLADLDKGAEEKATAADPAGGEVAISGKLSAAVLPPEEEEEHFEMDVDEGHGLMQQINLK